MRRITDREMTEMCLAVNLQRGTAAANRLLDLFGAARREIEREDALREAAGEAALAVVTDPERAAAAPPEARLRAWLRLKDRHAERLGDEPEGAA